MVDAMPGYSGPVLKGAIGGGVLAACLGALLGYAAYLAKFDVPFNSIAIWAILAGALGALQGGSHLGLLTHRKRQAIIHGVDLDDHHHEHEH